MSYQVGDRVMVACTNAKYPAIIRGYLADEESYVVRFDDADQDASFGYIEDELELINEPWSHSI